MSGHLLNQPPALFFPQPRLNESGADPVDIDVMPCGRQADALGQAEQSEFRR